MTFHYWVWVQNDRLAWIYHQFYAFNDDLEKGQLIWDDTSSDGCDDLGEDDIPLSGCVQETAPFLYPVEELVEDQRGLLAERLSPEQSVDPLVADAAWFARQNAGG